ncbi:MAG: hypothetical protein STSR0002_14260 [Smithella sp.]|jgi:hypothetical protein
MTQAIENSSEKITTWDHNVFERLIAVDLTPIQIQRIIDPSNRFEKEGALLAIHWHPENVPLELIRTRIDVMYPNIKEYLIIPTQHNEIIISDFLISTEIAEALFSRPGRITPGQKSF